MSTLLDTIDSFTQGYITCALWSSNDESDDSGGNPMDDNYSDDDIAERALQEIIDDCKDFQKSNAELLEQYCEQKQHAAGYDAMECAGHDFWLTRNGHGTGFWDRGLGELGKKLSEAAKVYGGVDLYVGDDGKIYY